MHARVEKNRLDSDQEEIRNINKQTEESSVAFLNRFFLLVEKCMKRDKFIESLLYAQHYVEQVT